MRTLLCMVLFGALAHGGEPADTAEKQLLGCWKHIQNEKVFMRFEKNRVVRFKDGRQSFARVDYAPHTVGFWIQGNRLDYPVIIEDNTLAFGVKTGMEIYKKLDGVPPELEIKPLALPKPKSLTPEQIKEIQTDLLKRREEDQAVRTDPAKRDKMGEVDAANSAALKKLVLEIGWIDAARFGPEGAHAAFLFVQHSGDLPLMLAALPEIERDLKAKRLRDGQSYALLYDRTKLFMAERQRFGTQVSMNEKKQILVFPLEDREKVEQFRKELGLIPYTEYLSYFKKQAGNDEVIYLDE